jgi:two-component system, NtrC family, response regulator AtoC
LRILLVDDESDVRKSLFNFLVKLGHTVVCAADGMEGLREFHSDAFNLVITDIRMPGMDGLELLQRIKQVERSPVDVIVVTGHGDMDNAIKALKFGAYDYLLKPLNVRELAITIDRSAEYTSLRENYTRLKEEFQERVEFETQAVRGEKERLRAAYLDEIGLDGLRVYSEAMGQVIQQAEKYSADRTLPVLIQGESGTGKELVARYIHHYGQSRGDIPFVAIDCGAISQELFEGELFGHEPGAYTGATSKGRIGKLEAANGGTVFLDEIGEMPPKIQVKLLRVLEEKRLYRLGGIKEIPVDIRIISATNKDLRIEVGNKKFRLDLFYRVNLGTIRIPPLRERKEDILPLALRFIRRAFARRGRLFDRFTPTAEKFLLSYPWPGNIRQLKNAMERVSVLLPWDRVGVDDLESIEDLSQSNSPAVCSSLLLGRDDFELPEQRLDLEELNALIIKRALEKNRGNRTRTAQYLGISRRVLQGKLKSLSIT